METRKTVCRLCAATCGMIAQLDDDGRVVSLRGDHDHPLSSGYACIRGLQAHEGMNSPDRILRPLKRLGNGSFAEIDLDVALDEIAERLASILKQCGPDAVGLFKGTQAYKNVAGNAMINAWPKSIGSSRIFSTITIDQSAKQVTMRRMGYWDAGRHQLHDSDVLLVFGSNPMLSMTFANLFNDPVKRLKAAIRRGLKLIVVDPRKTETAGLAHMFVQPKPGEDSALVAGVLRVILENGWHDQVFCERYVCGMEALRAAVDPFGVDYVAARCGIEAGEITGIARMFAHDACRGIAAAGTGPSMSPHSNLADHLIECLNAVCGRYRQAGEPVANPGVQRPRRVFRAEVVPGHREWENGPRTGSGHGMLFGELMSGVLSDEMLRTDGRALRALFVHGGNPAAALPDQRKAVAALRTLDLLVAIEPFLTTTAKLCDYILPPKLQYERTDTAIVPQYEPLLEIPFAQYAPAIATEPAGSQLIDDWYPYWALARRLGRTIVFEGAPLDMMTPPTTKELIAIVLRDAQVPFSEIRQHPEGHVFDVEPAFVEEPRDDATARLELLPTDVADDLIAILTASAPPEEFPYLLSVRRLRGLVNSLGILQPGIRKRHPYNAAYLHPVDLIDLGCADGGQVEIISDHGRIPAIAEADATMRRGVVSMSHCWGGLPDESLPFEELGASTNLLVRTDAWVEAINAMPRMSAVPVRINVIGEATSVVATGFEKPSH